MSRFTILRHDAPSGTHFDFMLEAGDVLKTWSLPHPPEADVETSWEALADHRLAYLDYEGPISGDRGAVARWDRGTYTVQRWSDKECVVDLAGAKITGQATLSRQSDATRQWTFSFAGCEKGGIAD